MPRSPLRKDKTCLNCNYVVENRFCPNCGQENTDTRKTFHHLFVHFFEDLTHYENSFWKTIRNLIFKPAALTKEYLSGKRLSYLAPVRLYIFISFVTFFIIAVFPTNKDELVNLDQNVTTQVKDKDGKMVDSVISKKKISLSELLKQQEEDQKKQHLTNEQKNENFLNFGYKNIRELDSFQKYGTDDDKLSDFEYSIAKKALVVKSKHTKKELWDKFTEEAMHNIPKTLFIYMPMFALVLWLFHGKRRWYYFDHGIFTLHYFSFLLLSILIAFLFNEILGLFGESTVVDVITGLFDITSLAWTFYYFFPAYHRFYGESRAISLIKSVCLFVINVILIIIVVLLFAVYTFINIH